ncbi:MAG TPA: DEAD/DEAH box helicase [Vicinamibacteria bacterium]|nr:DEAD/DEAH box helicase [Vicinamibacteria bacterium]
MTSILAPADRGQALQKVIAELEGERSRPQSITAVRHFPPLPADLADFPPELMTAIADALKRRGIDRLYAHQKECFERVRAGENVVVVTPTASGKTLCYNLPVLDRVLREPDTRALYLFPTKALSQDQLAELHGLIQDIGADIRVFTYDGDTPQDARKAIRARGHLVVTNPDMLHSGILPHHPKWVKLFENLRYIVIDEVHAYRGVFGSHLANIIRRLKRICRFYGAEPRFICSSATIANPKELAEALLEEPVELIARNGAPRGEKYFVFYNPPVVNPELGIRRSYINETRRIATSFLKRGLQTIVFATSRLATEVLVTYLKNELEQSAASKDIVRGYRGGYLPKKRREIEAGLREGTVLGVVSTNALELGIDIGALDVAVIAGYPGTIASTWQQAGRAGRRTGASVAVFIANSNPLNQFIVNHPDYFFSGSPEHGLINPDNLSILVDHVKCAAFELPFRDGERFGGEDLAEILSFLEEHEVLHHAGDRWHWTSEAYPADSVSLRSVSSDNFVVYDETREPKIIAEVDFVSAHSTLHPKAIYILEGQQYIVERFEYDERRASVRQWETDYFTDAITYTKVNILDRFEESTIASGRRSYGEVHVVSQVVGFKKIKFYTLENVGSGELDMPEIEMHTTAYWLTIPREILSELPGGSEERRDGVVGLANTLKTIAMLFLMCDRSDVGVAIGDNSQGTASVERGFRRPLPAVKEPVGPSYEPNVFLYDNYPGGIGFSEPLYRLHPKLLSEARMLIESCPCHEGCPSCVGPVGEVGARGKEMALAILERLAPR